MIPETIFFLGKPHKILLSFSPANVSRVSIVENQIKITLPARNQSESHSEPNSKNFSEDFWGSALENENKTGISEKTARRWNAEKPGRARPIEKIGKIDNSEKVHKSGKNSLASDLLFNWLKAQAAKQIFQRVNFFQNKMSLKVVKITLKDTSSRWGSCSRRGNLNFNWRLIMAPSEILDYVVVHEIAHLQEMNHSPDFWEIVSYHCPTFKNCRVWLKTIGGKLFSV
ncbi:MAG: M48 family metallopeptidase [Candidatus Riflebacteria bacterium]|nr:M48 family metallopeptidase [Candidatus Riflebacteria bacterium]